MWVTCQGLPIDDMTGAFEGNLTTFSNGGSSHVSMFSFEGNSTWRMPVVVNALGVFELAHGARAHRGPAAAVLAGAHAAALHQRADVHLPLGLRPKG